MADDRQQPPSEQASRRASPKASDTPRQTPPGRRLRRRGGRRCGGTPRPAPPADTGQPARQTPPGRLAVPRTQAGCRTAWPWRRRRGDVIVRSCPVQRFYSNKSHDADGFRQETADFPENPAAVRFIRQRNPKRQRGNRFYSSLTLGLRSPPVDEQQDSLYSKKSRINLLSGVRAWLTIFGPKAIL